MRLHRFPTVLGTKGFSLLPSTHDRCQPHLSDKCARSSPIRVHQPSTLIVRVPNWPWRNHHLRQWDGVRDLRRIRLKLSFPHSLNFLMMRIAGTRDAGVYRPVMLWTIPTISASLPIAIVGAEMNGGRRPIRLSPARPILPPPSRAEPFFALVRSRPQNKSVENSSSLSTPSPHVCQDPV